MKKIYSSDSFDCFCNYPLMCANRNYCTTNTACYYSVDLTSKLETYGCMTPDSDHHHFHCNPSSTQLKIRVLCCTTISNHSGSAGNGDLCNQNLTIEDNMDVNFVFNIFTSPHFLVILLFCIAFILLLFFLFLRRISLACYWKHRTEEEQTRICKESHSMSPSLVNAHEDGRYLLNKRCYCNSREGRESGSFGTQQTSELSVISPNSGQCTVTTEMEESLQVAFDDGLLSEGSGKGILYLEPRTIGRQIQLEKCIGHGRYGEVWRGRLQAGHVAVKVFSSLEEANWKWECYVYQAACGRHENILTYYAADIISKEGSTQMWIVFQYHSSGSLYDYLKCTNLCQINGSDGLSGSILAALRMAHSAAAGLCHLHMELTGVETKPAIAHRDVKSKNILLMSNGECCIADFGLALIEQKSFTNCKRQIHGNNQTEQLLVSNWLRNANLNNARVGTKRYMAPELLKLIQQHSAMGATDSVPLSSMSFEGLKAADMYAFALVLWEVLQTILSNCYQMPFEGIVDADPSYEQMYSCAYEKQCRPAIHLEGINNNERLSADDKLVLLGWANLLTECWVHIPDRRHTALYTKKFFLNTFRRRVYRPEQEDLVEH